MLLLNLLFALNRQLASLLILDELLLGHLGSVRVAELIQSSLDGVIANINNFDYLLGASLETVIPG